MVDGNGSGGNADGESRLDGLMSSVTILSVQNDALEVQNETKDTDDTASGHPAIPAHDTQGRIRERHP